MGNGLGTDILYDQPEWGGWLPDGSNDYFKTTQDYLDYLKQYHDQQPWVNQPPFAPPGTVQGADGQTLQSAGYTDPYHPNDPNHALNQGEYWANYLNNKFQRIQGSDQVTYGMGLTNWIKLHPDEAKLAFEAFDIDPKTGLPTKLMADPLYNLIAQQLGTDWLPDTWAPPPPGPGSPDVPMDPTQPPPTTPEATGAYDWNTTGALIPQVTQDTPFLLYDPNTGQYTVSSHLPNPNSGYVQIDPTTGQPFDGSQVTPPPTSPSGRPDRNPSQPGPSGGGDPYNTAAPLQPYATPTSAPPLQPYATPEAPQAQTQTMAVQTDATGKPLPEIVRRYLNRQRRGSLPVMPSRRYGFGE